MAEDDEIDILGDYSFDNFLRESDTLFGDSILKCDDNALVSQNTDLLKLDYTIHPEWLQDKPSTNPANWYSSPDANNPDTPTTLDVETCAGQNNFEVNGWTEKEKDLLRRGIEIFGKNCDNLSQFMGSKTPVEVKYFLKNFYVKNDDCIQETVVFDDIIDAGDVLNEVEISTATEESITTDSWKVEPRLNKTKKKHKDLPFNYKNIPVGHSLLKKNCRHLIEDNSQPNKIKHVMSAKKRRRNEKNIKFKTKLNLNLIKDSIKKSRKRGPSNTDSVLSFGTKSKIITGEGLSVPVCDGEEVIKLKSADSDVEIDVEISDEESQKITKSDINSLIPKFTTDDKVEIMKHHKQAEMIKSNGTQKRNFDMTELNEIDVKFLTSTEFPKSEYVIDESKISDLEKFFHYDFFEGRPTKTPERFVKIRSHILTVWKNSKPSYVTKTSIRQGLKQCGDVNCISRIHQFLEQIGAINFKCAQTSYIRPLYELMLISQYSSKEKKITETNLTPLKSESHLRNRNWKKYIDDGDGGYTLQHDEKGAVVNTTVVNEDHVRRKQYNKKPLIRLIYCRPLSEERDQEYKVQIDLSTLLLMDLHAHSSLSEIMGLVGGYWNFNEKVLKIRKYEPCKNLASSATHCDMCPITQARAAERLSRENLKMLGWFHSHPTFAPEPSQQDVDTQLSLQQCFGNDKPCIGVILSPFSSHGALIASPYRIMIVKKKENFDDQYVPFKLNVEVDATDFLVSDVLSYASKILRSDFMGTAPSVVNFSKPYFQDNSITYLDKFISSVKMHLAKCSNINKMTCDAIVQGLSKLCYSKS